MSTTAVTAGQIMDRVANLLNDPKKTDYSYAVQLPYLNMAIEEFSDLMVEANAPLANAENTPSYLIVVPAGISTIIATELSSTIPVGPNWPRYPPDLVEIQEVAERPSRFPTVTPTSPPVSPPPQTINFPFPNPVGGLWEDQRPFKRLPRVEFRTIQPMTDSLQYWLFENGTIVFNTPGANQDMEVEIKYISQGVPYVANENTVIFAIGARTYLAYKTAALCAFFIGENETRAQVLQGRADEAVDRSINISNKGRQQIMTRHRPFRAAFKSRGGF